MKKNALIIILPILIIAVAVFVYFYNNIMEYANTEINFEKVQLIEVIDGDTITIENSFGQKRPVRLIGIDAPEKDGPYTKEEDFGEEAHLYLENLLKNKYTLYLQKDKTNKDEYGRLLRYLWLEEPLVIDKNTLENKMVNAILVKEGLASAKEYPPDTKYSIFLNNLMIKAKENNKGMYEKNEEKIVIEEIEPSDEEVSFQSDHNNSNDEPLILEDKKYFKPNRPPIQGENYHIEIYKSQRLLKLFLNDYHEASLKIALSSASIGDKEMEGDKKTPEGEYYICTINKESAFTLFFGLSYPNIKDAKKGFDNGSITEVQYNNILKAIEQNSRPNWYTPLGGEIGIHGGGTNSDWTLGCIALSNEDILFLEDYLSYNTKVLIYP